MGRRRSRGRGGRGRRGYVRPWPKHLFVFGLCGLGVTAVVFALLLTGTSSPIYVNWLLAINFGTYVLFRLDKNMSNGSDRAPEKLLHLFTLLGGSAGQYLGRTVPWRPRRYQHKTSAEKRASFNLVLLTSLFIHGTIATVLFLPA